MSAQLLGNQPAEFRGFLTAPHHRLFAAFDDMSGAEEALAALRFEGHGDEHELWVFSGDEGAGRLDATGLSHGVLGFGVRLVQHVRSSDAAYLRTLAACVRDGGTAVAVWVRDEQVADEVGHLLWLHGAHSLAYFTHLDFVPVAA